MSEEHRTHHPPQAEPRKAVPPGRLPDPSRGEKMETFSCQFALTSMVE